MMHNPYPEPLLIRQQCAHKWLQLENESLLIYKELICAMQDNYLRLKYQDWHRSVLQTWLESSNQHRGVISTYIEQQRYTPHEASPIW